VETSEATDLAKNVARSRPDGRRSVYRVLTAGLAKAGLFFTTTTICHLPEANSPAFNA